MVIFLQIHVNQLIKHCEKFRTVHTTSVCAKIQAGRYRPSPKGDFPLTYEMAQPPEYIAHRKSWNSWNTCKF